MNEEEIVNSATWEGVQKKVNNQVIIKEDWVQITTPGFKAPYLNGIYKSNLTSENAESKILETISYFKGLDLPFRWKVCSSSSPSNLENLLLKNGLVLKDTLFGLIAMISCLEIPINPQIKIVPLSETNIDDWSDTQIKAWNVPTESLEQLKLNSLINLKKGGKSNRKEFIAYYEDKPIASASFNIRDKYYFFSGAAVNPEYREMGVYKTLLKFRVDYLKSFEQKPIVIHCVKETSAPICLKLGFKKVSEIRSYELPST